MISDIRLQNFRSYHDEQLEFGDGVNIIVGPNASGKTNLLEAILVLCRGSSYRASDTELIMHGKDWARLDSHVDGHERAIKFQLAQEVVKKEYIIDGTTLKRLPALRTVPAVVFEPSHLQLLTTTPELRRNFLDDIIEQTVPGFSETRRNYRRALAQRNSLLKQTFTHDQLFVWNIRLSELGGVIAQQRMRFVDEHSGELTKLYNKLAGKRTKSAIAYETKLQKDTYSSSLLKALEARTEIDKERGFTTVGPHRDDLGIYLGGYTLASSASRGETRTILLALKLLEVQVLERARGVKPILLLDDVFGELDGARRLALTEYLKNHQTFITTTDADIVVQHFLDNCTIIPTQKT